MIFLLIDSFRRVLFISDIVSFSDRSNVSTDTSCSLCIYYTYYGKTCKRTLVNTKTCQTLLKSLYIKKIKKFNLTKSNSRLKQFYLKVKKFTGFIVVFLGYRKLLRLKTICIFHREKDMASPIVLNLTRRLTNLKAL